MDHVVGHIVRRGLDAHASFRASNEGLPEGDFTKIPVWGATLLISTFAVFVFLFATVEYTYGHVIATLSMVESPTAVLFEPLPNDDPDAPIDDGKKAAEPDLVLVKQAPITAKLCTAARHLRSRAGRLYRFRGISAWVVYQFIFARLTMFFANLTAIPRGVDAVLAAVILARLRTGWTHIVITEASPKYWFQRLPGWKTWKHIALPTAVLAICEQITIGLPVVLFSAFGLDKINHPESLGDLSESERKLFVVKAIAVVILGFFSAVAIVVPATVSLTRVQASLVSEEEETIVPFDRSFGGRVVPASVGGAGVVSMLEAWKTFDWNSRVRLLKLYVKVCAMQVGLTVLFFVAIAAQVHLIMGDQIRRYVEKVRQN